MNHFQLIVIKRIDDHKEAEEKRLEAEHVRIAEEERRKAEAAVRAEQQTAPVVSAPTTVVSRPAPVASPAPKADTGARVRLGEINSRIAPLSITAEGLAQLGFPHVETDKSAKLYRASDFEAICGAMAQHITAVANQLQQAA